MKRKEINLWLIIIIVLIWLSILMSGCGYYLIDDIQPHKSCPKNPYYPLIQSAIEHESMFYEHEKTKRIRELVRAGTKWDSLNPCRCVIVTRTTE